MFSYNEVECGRDSCWQDELIICLNQLDQINNSIAEINAGLAYAAAQARQYKGLMLEGRKEREARE